MTAPQAFYDRAGSTCPPCDPEDRPGEETIYGLGNRKNEIFHDLLHTLGVEVFEDAVEMIGHWRN